MSIRSSVCMASCALLASCGVLYTDKKTERSLHDGVLSRVNRERVDAVPTAGSYPESQFVVLSLADAAVRDYTSLELVPGEGYVATECPASAPKAALCVRVEKSAQLQYRVVGHYTQNRPLLEGGGDKKTATSTPRSLSYEIAR